jgi:UDP-N-acetyl-D-mannosaminuronic acid dehydrogenase
LALSNNAYRYIEFATRTVLSDRQAAGLITGALRRDEAQLSARPRHSRRAVPAVLMKDTAQLAAFAQNQFSLGNAAMLVNEGLVCICDDLRRRPISRMTVGLFRHGLQGRHRRYPRFAQLQVQEGVKSLAGAVHHRSFVTTDLGPRLDEVVERSDL